ncbi:hypothetical protein [Kineococcus sp. SYSU DK004]|uniref:hypothetical protein n=1 Tax=Kineococcus sp. SYSU DK004 TaxID=3383125 RepID=UPI003D7F02F0
MPVDAPVAALLVVSALHAGFQAVVTVVVYPALADLARSGSTDRAAWAVAHAAHSRRTTVLVAPLYLALLAVWGWVLLAVLPSTGPSPGAFAALAAAGAGTALAGGTTALVAARLHVRLGREGPRPELVAALLRADRVRCAGALLALAGAVAVGSVAA